VNRNSRNQNQALDEAAALYSSHGSSNYQKVVDGEIVVSSTENSNGKKKKVVINYAEHHIQSVNSKGNPTENQNNFEITPIVTTSDEDHSSFSSLIN